MAFKTIATLIFLFLLSCTKNPTQTGNHAAPVMELRLFSWSDYFDEKTIRQFEKETGIIIKFDYFSSNEQLLAKLQVSMRAGGDGYDLILPSDYMVRNMRELNLLSVIDHTKLPFLAQFDPNNLNPDYDQGLKHSVPMALGTTGVAVNTKLLPKLKSLNLTWKGILENPEFKGKVMLLDDAKEITQVLLMLKGKSLGTASEQNVIDAYKYLSAHKDQIKAFTAESRPAIEAGDCAICMAYSGDVLKIAKTKPEIKYVIPSDGASTWTDNFAIPTNAKNIESAYKFINFVLSAEGAKAFTERTGYRTANLKARELLPKDVSDNKIIYPSAAEMARFRYIVDKKELALVIDKEWTKLKSE